MKKTFEYYIPKVAIALVKTKQAADPRCPAAPPIQAAFEQILFEGYTRLSADAEFSELVRESVFPVQKENSEVWHKVNLTLHEDLHDNLCAYARAWNIWPHILSNILFLFCTPALDYANVRANWTEHLAAREAEK